MAHPYYTHQDEIDLYRRQKQDTPLSGSQSMRNEAAQELSDESNSRASPTAEPDGKNRTLPPRRRIQVACNRCRRRKIKCSGDSGDGQGCSNCRSSGTPNCQFLRVNSSELQTRASYSGWPYPATNTFSFSSSHLGNYNSHPASKSATSSNVRSTSYSRQSGYSVRGSGHRNAFTRNAFAASGSANYDDDSSAAQSIHSPSYMLPNANSSLIVGYSGYPGSPKLWNPPPNINKSQNGTLYSDQDPLNPLEQTDYPYMGSGSHVSLPTDIPSLFPAITSLSSNGQGPDRTLPNPSSRSQLLNSTTTLASLPEMAPSSLVFLSGTNYKPTNQWTSQSTNSPRSQASTRTMSSGATSVSPVNGTKTASSTTQDIVFEYMNMTNSASPPAASSDTTYNAADTVDPAENFQTHPDSGLTRSLSRDDESLLSLDSCSPDAYGYSTSERSRRRSRMGASGSSTLMNGMQYTRVRQPEAHSTLPFDILHSDAVADYRASTDLHRTSISSLSNQNGY